MKKHHINGQLFEIFILKLVLMSGYKLLTTSDVDLTKIRFVRNRFIEFKGRGDYHQIDIPVDLIYRPSFIYPIRLLGEVKFRSSPIDKSFIREEIGKMKDIQESYFVDGSLTDEMRTKRRLEVFFSLPLVLTNLLKDWRMRMALRPSLTKTTNASMTL